MGFTKLGFKECASCAEYANHCYDGGEACGQCSKHIEHIRARNEARSAYRADERQWKGAEVVGILCQHNADFPSASAFTQGLRVHVNIFLPGAGKN